MRSPLWLASSLVLLALVCFLIAVAAGLISDKDSSATTTSSASSAAGSQPTAGSQPSGWAHAASYVGRYRLDVVPSNANPSSATATTGSSGSQRITGELTLFLRTIKHTEPVALSGILALNSAKGEQLVYMTDLTSKQGVLHAEINGGSYFGPVIGSFTGIRHSANLSGIVNLAGFGGLEVQMIRDAHSSTP